MLLKQLASVLQKELARLLDDGPRRYVMRYSSKVFFCLHLNARRAELVDSGAADPNISRRERLSSEPILCLDDDVLTLPMIIKAALT